MSELSLAYDQEYGCPQRRPFFVRATAVGLASLVLFFTVGTSVYAYESPDVTDGHPLYFMKSGIEYAREGLARSPEARAKFHAQMMDRRLQEGEHHFPARPDRVPPTLERAARQLEQSTKILAEIKDEELREQLSTSLSLKRERYLQLRSRVQASEPGITGP